MRKPGFSVSEVILACQKVVLRLQDNSHSAAKVRRAGLALHALQAAHALLSPLSEAETPTTTSIFYSKSAWCPVNC